ncbi:response regulator transcription factor [Erysipelothrix sp. HDW6C]|uniref:LytR/AlgR family response regulator transcription factor n=1 Tax=Erysipelothrix sp. HDW6C TaxID=2714930 RepID=UPI00140E54F7|nr:LytTR family DNA-binding domain-containing protein [Erysipelothrix sp. HDW6C]QIK69455.1 response regulator transcription factor [Erysipelothrix sp. HDW6C]
MKIAIVEDNELMQQQLHDVIQEASQKAALEIEISCFSNGQSFIDQFQNNFDLIYLDVEMPELNGMQTAQAIRSFPSDAPIVFVTNFVQYAVEGYSVEAFDFILKPINPFKFENHFNKFLKRYSQTDNAPTITVKYKNEITKLRLDDIYFIESQGHYVHYHTDGKSVISIETLKAIEEQLAPYAFYRCNNHYLVNLNHVSSIKDDTAFVGKYALRISRPRKKDFMNALTEHLGGR